MEVAEVSPKKIRVDEEKHVNKKHRIQKHSPATVCSSVTENPALIENSAMDASSSENKIILPTSEKKSQVATEKQKPSGEIEDSSTINVTETDSLSETRDTEGQIKTDCNYMSHMVKSNVIEDIQVFKFAECIGKNWEMLGAHLGLSEVKMDHIKKDNSHSEVLKIHAMLSQWKNQKGMEATIDNLLDQMNIVQATVNINWKELYLSFRDKIEKHIRCDKVLSNQTVKEKETLSLECYLTIPDMPVVWKKNERQLVSDNNRVKILCHKNIHQFVIADVISEDAAVYACVFGNTSTECTVTVEELPAEFSTQLTDQRVKENETLILECQLTKANVPVNWLKDGKNLMPDHRVLVSTDQCSHTLTITDVTMIDEGTYACVCVEKKTECKITVEDAEAIFEEPETSEEIIWNIPTDCDEIQYSNDKDMDISLREYQKELAHEGSKGRNVIIVAPTNSGKTRVACKIIQVHLRGQRQNNKVGRVIFLVENEVLAFQQGQVFSELLPTYRLKVISGSVQRDKKQLLKDFLDKRDILVVTAQILLNCLNQKEIESLTKFSLLVFDECHHTSSQHRYNEIMKHYMDVKFAKNVSPSDLPQVVGLTASLGTGGYTDENRALTHMKKLLANLDTKFLCTVRRQLKDIAQYQHFLKEEIVTTHIRSNDRFKEAILSIVARIDNYMISHPSMIKLATRDQFIRTACRVQTHIVENEQFHTWIREFKDSAGKVQCEDVNRMLNPCILHLEAYNKALMIHNDARIKDAQAILEKVIQSYTSTVESPADSTDRILLDMYNGLKSNCFDNQPENPKLVKMQEIITDHVLADDENGRGIIFVKTRELAKALVTWMRETEPLRKLHATEFVGQAASLTEGGMTKRRQKDALHYFKGGQHKLLVATSVAEEGLDITQCKLVIRYEYVTNEIVRVQSRGRARAKDSHYFVLTSEGSPIVDKEEKNAMLEKLMNSIIPVLQSYLEDHPDKWEKESYQIQEAQKQLEEVASQKRQANMTDDVVEFQCRLCRQFLCWSTDVRVIKDAHHVCINEDINTRILTNRDKKPQFEEIDFKVDGSIVCAGRRCTGKFVVGQVCEYQGLLYPIMKISQIRFVNKSGEGSTFKRWKDKKFIVASLALGEVNRHIIK